jgi:hypothetical protein
MPTSTNFEPPTPLTWIERDAIEDHPGFGRTAGSIQAEMERYNRKPTPQQQAYLDAYMSRMPTGPLADPADNGAPDQTIMMRRNLLGQGRPMQNPNWVQPPMAMQPPGVTLNTPPQQWGGY